MIFDSFLVRAAFAGLGVALAAAPLGCFIIWRRMAFFGDATAHAAILGVALALAAGAPIFAGVLIVAFAMALFVSFRDARQSADALLAVAAHSALAAGLVAVSFLQVRVDIESLLFGDILAVSRSDLAIIWIGAALVAGLLYWRWDALLAATLNADLAHASGIDPRREQLILTIGLALLVAVAIKVIGALLISAMLIIPAAAARPLAATPERMAVGAAIIGIASALGGLAISWFADTPTGPTIVCTATGLFIVTSVVQRAIVKR